jgi:acetoacetate decarboxylase
MLSHLRASIDPDPRSAVEPISGIKSLLEKGKLLRGALIAAETRAVLGTLNVPSVAIRRARMGWGDNNQGEERFDRSEGAHPNWLA